jgi:hypothetical protein
LFDRSDTVETPSQFKSYPCDEYYQSALSLEGYWDEIDKLWLIEPAERVREQEDASFLQIGRPGFDSIGFGYRKGHAGIWAFHRMEGEYQYLAPTLMQFLDQWLSGHLSI